MTIFFTASLRAKAEYLKTYQTMYQFLKKDHTVLADHVFNLELKEVSGWSPEYHFAYYQTVLERIKDAEVVVAEVSSGSLNVGYEISIALQQRKPVIALYLQGTEPAMLNQVDTHLFETKMLAIEYQSKTVTTQLSQALSEVKKNLMQRFTLLLPSHLINHLDQVAYQTGVARSVYIRRLIEADSQCFKTVRTQHS